MRSIVHFRLGENETQANDGLGGQLRCPLAVWLELILSQHHLVTLYYGLVIGKGLSIP